MPLPRYKQINLDITPFYHCTSRCVRQSYLCGIDEKTGKNYEHRRQWVVNRLHELSLVFAVDLCAYAIMHNHTHLVLHIAKARATHWSMDEVILRWRTFYNCPSVVERYLDKEQKIHLTTFELELVANFVAKCRKRLYSISWFMRMLNEYIARKANNEDKCTGYFWERRFKSQAILSEHALAAVMAYTDLNPVRAKIAETPENSNFTSIQYRINAEKAHKLPSRLMLFKDQASKTTENYLPFTLSDYLTLVDQTGRIIRSDKRGAISENLSPILERLKIQENSWITLATKLECKFSGAIGPAIHMNQFALACNYGRKPNISNAVKYFQ